jgi:hypothetical protein
MMNLARNIIKLKQKLIACIKIYNKALLKVYLVICKYMCGLTFPHLENAVLKSVFCSNLWVMI